MNSQKILLVEDNLDHLKFAKQAFTETFTNQAITLDTVHDYASWTEKKKEDYVFIISDLFFPAKTGSEDFSLGQTVYNKIKQERKNIISCPLVHRSNRFDKELEMLKRAVHQEKFALRYDGHMSEDMKRSNRINKHDFVTPHESDQPLGVLVAEDCKYHQKPYLIITSGHDHGDLASVVIMYFQYLGIKTDCLIIIFREIYNKKLGTFFDQEEYLLEKVKKSSWKDYAVDKKAKYLPYYQSYTDINHRCLPDIDKNDPKVWKQIFQLVHLYLQK